jgi:hypothetical protein
MNLYDMVALIEDIPEDGLKRGQIGTVIEEWQPGVYEVEFYDTDGITYAMLALREEQLMTLYWHPDTKKQSA